MRVAVVTSSFPSHDQDPSGHFVQAEVRELIEAGHEVTVFLPRRVKRGGGGVADHGATLCELPHLGLFGWPGAVSRLRERPWRAIGLGAFVARARAELKQRGPFEEVVAHWIVPAFWPICRDFVGPTHVVCHGSDVRLLEELPQWPRRSILDALGRKNVELRCVSHELAERLRGLARKDARSLPPIAVRPASMTLPSLPSKAELRKQLGWLETFNVVIVGRAVPAKRIDVAIEVARAAEALVTQRIAAAASPPTRGADAPNTGAKLVRTRRRTAIAIHAIGDGPARERWMLRYPEIEWVGQLPRDETLRRIAAAQVVLSASELEGAPTVIREARALQTDVVAASAGDLDATADGGAGLHVTADFAADYRSEAVRILAAMIERHWREWGQ